MPGIIGDRTIKRPLLYQIIAKSDPFAWWPMNEATGETTIVDAAGSLDLSITGSPTLQSAAPPLGSPSISFDGSNDALSHAEVADLRAQAPMSVECFFRLTGGTPDLTGMLVSKIHGGARGWSLRFDTSGNHRLAATVYYLANAIELVVDPGVSLGNTWHYAAFTVSAAHSGTLYLDNETPVTDDGTGGITPEGDKTFNIADRDNSGQDENKAEAEIAAVAFYKAELTAAQIAERQSLV